MDFYRLEEPEWFLWYSYSQQSVKDLQNQWEMMCVEILPQDKDTHKDRPKQMFIFRSPPL